MSLPSSFFSLSPGVDDAATTTADIPGLGFSEKTRQILQGNRKWN